MRYYAFIITAVLTFLPVQTFSQSIASNISSMGDMPFAKKMTILDTALVKVYYQLEFKKDSTKSDRTEAQTVLLIGNRYTLFTDYYTFLSDSLAQEVDKRKQNRVATTAKLFGLWKNAHYKQWNICDLHNNTTIKQEEAWARYYEYEEQTPSIDWQLAEQDSLISGLSCGKATCRYRGRDYVAWYLKDVPLPFGPYLFYGLGNV